ncbi:hypothetical protein N6H05_01435 [Sphingobium sp. WTD-1]|uniref:hypothetical protein n=1 Tax=Sphingobium sp. WTD-1 TaxID=2979467 RepID=UPI0024DEE6D3|nr:hypothetical protein [Sphingobium sp. WTD-1]WIA56515.1 hypothetical protein N6H05_01435 [Sphingobium sp. WTD-1]
MAKHRCDVTGCSQSRSRWQRVCTRCFTVLPRQPVLALIAAYRLGDRPTWRALQKKTGRLLENHLACKTRLLSQRAGRLDRTMPHVSAQQAFRNHQRLLGEQD